MSVAEWSTTDVRRKAIEVLDERGWWQGAWSADPAPEKHAPVCMMGAVAIALFGSFVWDSSAPEEASSLYRAVWAELQTELGGGGYTQGFPNGPEVSPAAWQDERGRTLDEVKTLLRGEWAS